MTMDAIFCCAKGHPVHHARIVDFDKERDKPHYELFIRTLEQETKSKLYRPHVRGSRQELIPSLETRQRLPCLVCAVAEYNRLCSNARKCAALTYYTMQLAATVNNSAAKFRKETARCSAPAAKRSGRTRRGTRRA